MIIDSFDDKSMAKINPKPKENRLKCDACIVTFSNIIEEYVLKNYNVEQCSTYKMVTGTFPIYKINYNGKIFAFYKTFLGAPASVGILEDVTEVIDTNKFVVFGGSGCLDREIAHGKVMIPTYAYRDEGTSYHYAKAEDYIKIKNSNIVANFMKEKEIELKATEIKVIGDCDEDYPIQPKQHTKEFLREQAYLRPRTTLFQAVFRVRSVVSMAIHEYFQSHGYIYLHAPLFTASDCEGAGEIFQVTSQDMDKVAKTGMVDYSEEFFRKKVSLSVSGQLEAETFAQAFTKVYTFGPSFRADPSRTPYHAAEFWQIEPEVAFCDIDGIMDIAEDVLKFVIKYALEHCKEELEYLDKYEEQGLIEKLEKTITQDFKRVTYKECIEILQKAKREWEFKPEYGADIAKEHEKYLTEYFKCPIFITMWKKELKSFYMKQLDDGTVAAADLELPGIGETFGMSQREDNYDKLLERMKDLDMKIEEYEWYLKLRKYGTCERSGFGIGFERLLMYITGIKNIRDVIPYPRTYGSCEY